MEFSGTPVLYHTHSKNEVQIGLNALFGLLLGWGILGAYESWVLALILADLWVHGASNKLFKYTPVLLATSRLSQVICFNPVR